MIEMTYAQTNGGFVPAVQKLARQTMPVKQAYALKKIVDAIQSQKKKIGDEFMKEVVEKFAKKGEDGKLVMNADGNYDVAPDQLNAFQAAQEAFGSKKFTIPREKLNLHHFENVPMSASDLSALDSIFEDPEEQPVAPVVPIQKS